MKTDGGQAIAFVCQKQEASPGLSKYGRKTPIAYFNMNI